MADSKQSLRREISKIREQLDRLAQRVDSIEEAEAADRVKTFIKGFDERIGGGLPPSHIILLAGPTGTMKSSLALSILTKQTQEGRYGTYLTFDESKDSLIRTASGLGFDVQRDLIVDVGEMRRVEEMTQEAGNWFDIIIKFLSRSKKKKDISIVIMDSFDGLLSYSENSSRDAISRFFHSLRELSLTVVIIDEAEDPADFPHHMDRLADGVIFLGRESASQRKSRLIIHCEKMRHTRHSVDYYYLDFKNGEFIISEIGPQ